MEELPDNGIVVTGLAETRLEPDVCRVFASVTEDDRDERKAYDRCTRRSNEVVAALRAEAGDDGRVTAPGVRVTARWDYKKGRETGFHAVSEIRVRAPAERAGALGRVAMEAGADRLGQTVFEVDDMDAAREALLAEAVAVARGKAERLAAAAGRPLGRVTAIVEQDDDEPIFPRGIARGARSRGGRRHAGSGGRGGGAGAPPRRARDGGLRPRGLSAPRRR